MFNHVQVSELPQLKTENINKKRYYITPDGNKYPSITTVLSNRNKKGLFEWRKRVGEDVANYVARTAANRGTKVHHMCEDFLNNKEVSTEPFFAACLFNQLKPILTKKINNIHFQECALYSDKLGIAGRVDCIAEYDGKLSIIDFKTSSRERTDEWNENYYIQASAYAEMYEERTGTPINQIVILVVTEDGTVQEFVREKTEEHLDMLLTTLNDFNKTNLSYISH
tara:strand:- start:237 stop:911 length:675 start_codon:yes stop_codon:yes gene_type:complete